MRFEKTYGLADVHCPHCDAEFDIEPTYEERKEDCYGTTQCPECGGKMKLASFVIFTVEKILEVDDD
jgi:hypothetical protein